MGRKVQTSLNNYTFATRNAQVAKLVDALVSGTSISDDVQVRVLSRAHLVFVTPCKQICLQGVFCVWGKIWGKMFSKQKANLH